MNYDHLLYPTEDQDGYHKSYVVVKDSNKISSELIFQAIMLDLFILLLLLGFKYIINNV